MKTLAFLGLAASLALIPVQADAKGGSRGGHWRAPMAGKPHMRPRPPMARPPMRMQHRSWGGKQHGSWGGNHGSGGGKQHHNWGPKQHGRWWGGWKAPGGWGGYRKPHRGFHVSRYWIAPSFYVGNWGWYGLPQPSNGLAWSRYYDDAVLIDGAGQVYDSRYGIDWDRGGYDGEGDCRDDGYDRGDDYDRDDRDDGVGGAVLGGVAGAIAGSAIAGRGDRTEGALIGAGVGAVTGALIDKAEDRGPPGARYADGADYDYGHADDRVTDDGRYDGSWTGEWDGPDRYRGSWNGTYEGRPGADYAPPPEHRGCPGPYRGQGYSYGYGQGMPGTTTVVVTPGVRTTTTTTTYIEEVAPRKVWRAKPVKRYRTKNIRIIK